MVNYKKAKIYKIVGENGDYFYGYTTQDLRKKLYTEKKKVINETRSVERSEDNPLHLNGDKNKREIILENPKIILVEYYECNNIEELRARWFYYEITDDNDKFIYKQLLIH